MKRIYLVKRLDYRHGASLNPHTPYNAVYDEECSVWRVYVYNTSTIYAVLPKFVEKVVEEASTVPA